MINPPLNHLHINTEYSQYSYKQVYMQLIVEHCFDDSHSWNYFQLYEHSIFIPQQFNDVTFVQKAFLSF